MLGCQFWRLERKHSEDQLFYSVGIRRGTSKLASLGTARKAASHSATSMSWPVKVREEL